MNVKLDTSGIENLEKILKKGAISTRVGILENSDSRSGDDIGNAELGLVHEFGSKSRNINENSFLRMPLNTEFSKRLDNYGLGEKNKILKELTLLGSVKTLGLKIGGIAVSTILEAFASNGFGKWSNKNGPNERTGMILRDTQKLMKSITFEVIEK